MKRINRPAEASDGNTLCLSWVKVSPESTETGIDEWEPEPTRINVMEMREELDRDGMLIRESASSIPSEAMPMEEELASSVGTRR